MGRGGMAGTAISLTLSSPHCLTPRPHWRAETGEMETKGGGRARPVLITKHKQTQLSHGPTGSN